MKRVVLASVIAAGLFAAVPGMTTAEASPLTCEHRSAAHVAEHGGIDADSAWHVSHGQLPNCGEDQRSEPRNEDESKPAEHNSDNNDRPRRDSPGFHCTWRGCG